MWSLILGLEPRVSTKVCAAFSFSQEELRKHHNVCDEETGRTTDKAHLEILDWHECVLIFETILLEIESSFFLAGKSVERSINYHHGMACGYAQLFYPFHNVGM